MKMIYPANQYDYCQKNTLYLNTIFSDSEALTCQFAPFLPHLTLGALLPWQGW
jgi:hypothetical protein